MKLKYKILVLLALIAATAMGVWFINNQTYNFGPVVTQHKAISSQPKFAGDWIWQDPKYTKVELSDGEVEYQEASLSLHLKDSNHKIAGKWQGSMRNGNRTDGCPSREDYYCVSSSEPASGNTISINFVTREDEEGEALLTYNPKDDTLTWQITQPPKGEYYAPQKEILKRL